MQTIHFKRSIFLIINFFFLVNSFVTFAQEDAIDSNQDSIVEFPDVEAQYPGGYAELQKYIVEHVSYDLTECDYTMVGKIYISFIVSSSGKLSHVESLRNGSNCEKLDQMYIQLIEGMPDWIPAEDNGRKVATRVKLPLYIHYN